MNKKLIIPTVILMFLALYNILNYTNRELFKTDESHLSYSSDGSLVLYMETAEVYDDAYCKIYVFDTSMYPNLKEEGTIPSTFQKNNPKTLFYIPVKFHARITNFDWNDKSNIINITQESVNDEMPLNYDIDLNSFSFYQK